MLHLPGGFSGDGFIYDSVPRLAGALNETVHQVKHAGVAGQQSIAPPYQIRIEALCVELLSGTAPYKFPEKQNQVL